MSFIRVAELDQWIQDTFYSRQSIRVSGGFRDDFARGDTPIPLLELEGCYAHTAHIVIPLKAPSNSNTSKNYAFTEDSGEWWEGWAPVLVASSLLSPIIDPVRWADLLRETRRIRFFCDTNALCRGTVAWLLSALHLKADIITSAINDRELAAWPDRSTDMWSAKTTKNWALRTQYRIGWRLVETPPFGVIIDRLSPEQGALMLAKLRTETVQEENASGKTHKTPDADMLLIELARGPIRDQPRNSRIVYLTGDRNNARAATNALGAENVLYAVADSGQAKSMQGKIVARGWWSPDGPLGTAIVPSSSHLLWNLLAACSFLILEADGGLWLIKPAYSVPRGVPSDFADPWLEIEQIVRVQISLLRYYDANLFRRSL